MVLDFPELQALETKRKLSQSESCKENHCMLNSRGMQKKYLSAPSINYLNVFLLVILNVMEFSAKWMNLTKILKNQAWKYG